ncbi:MAG: radical SAM protein [Acidimicrobiales bacterium]|nr:radical SAM protein [Acidimicrobiales bacterium]
MRTLETTPLGSRSRWRRALRSYQEGRATPWRDSVCNAPRTNLYFTVDGQVAPCWKYFPSPTPRWSPERSIADLWHGPELTRVRDALAEGRFLDRCAECRHDIATGDRPLAAAYDNDRPIGPWPSMLEMELSNVCNLECTMCNGQLSSMIRRNREHRPPLVSPYDETFVDQLDELIPHLAEIRFNGGEPFLHAIVHQIADRVAEIRPELRITIATNGTVLNAKVRRMLERNNIHLNVSIDSLVPERYEAIRVHADFSRLMENFGEFHAYCRANERELCVMVNPMRSNWSEMSDYLWWAAERRTRLWFNTILEPGHLALHNLPAAELASISDEMAARDLPAPDGPIDEGNAGVYRAWLHQLETWRHAAEADPARDRGVPVVLGPRSRPAEGR